MAHLKGPLLSEEAHGTLSKLLTYQKNNKRNALKRWNKPRDPKSNAQLSIRAMNGYLSSEWSNLSAAYQATWEPLAQRPKYAPYHAYLKFNMQRWRHFLPPALQYPPTDAAISPITPFGFTQPKYHGLYIGAGWVWPPNPDGWTLHVDTAAGFTASFANLKMVKTFQAPLYTYFRLYDVPPGTYYIRNIPWWDWGKFGTPSPAIPAVSTG